MTRAIGKKATRVHTTALPAGSDNTYEEVILIIPGKVSQGIALMTPHSGLPQHQTCPSDVSLTANPEANWKSLTVT